MTSSSQVIQTRDPVCGMTVKDSPEALFWNYQGVRYLFCAEGCREQFQDHPDQYAKTPIKPRTSRLGRELAIAAVLFLIALAAVLAFRSVRKATPSTSSYEPSNDVASLRVVQTEGGVA